MPLGLVKMLWYDDSLAALKLLIVFWNYCCYCCHCHQCDETLDLLRSFHMMSFEVFFEALTWFFTVFDFALKLLLLWPFVVDMMILLGLWRSFDMMIDSWAHSMLWLCSELLWFGQDVGGAWQIAWMGFADLRVERKFYCNKVCVRDRDTELLDFWMLEQQPLWMELCVFVFFSFHGTTTAATARNHVCCCSDQAFQKLWLLLRRASLQLVCMTFQPEWIPKDFSKPFPSLLQSFVAGRGDGCGFFLVVKKFTTLRLFWRGGVWICICAGGRHKAISSPTLLLLL